MYLNESSNGNRSVTWGQQSESVGKAQINAALKPIPQHLDLSLQDAGVREAEVRPANKWLEGVIL